MTKVIFKGYFLLFPEQQAAASSFTVESILSNIHYFRCYDYVELIALVHLLPDILKEHPKVKVLSQIFCFGIRFML